MTMFQKPKVAIAFSPQDEVEEPLLEAPVREDWANTPARKWALAILLAILCVAAFVYPTINGAFLPGDDATVKNNTFLYFGEGFRTIWGAPQRLPQVSPVSYSVYWFEHFFFAGRPRGYHVISIVLHACSAVMLWMLLRRLELPGAWLGAALFAIHPVQVDAVSWISQQRYLICGFFYFCGLLVYLRRAGLNPIPPPPAPGNEPLIQFKLPENDMALYAISIVFFVLALLSHVIGATFPLVVLVMIWWERGKLTRKDVVPLVAFLVLGAGFVVATAMIVYRRTGTLWLAFPGGANWIVIWGRGIWTYLLDILLPISLSFAPSGWSANSIHLWQWSLPIAAIFVLVALWVLRRRWGRGPITAALLFVCLLLPSALGATDAYDSELTGVMVREHVLYLACVAVLVPLAVWLSDWLVNSKFTRGLAAHPATMPIVSLVIIVPLGIATFVYSRAYNDEQSLWNNVLLGDGDSTIALNTLGQLELDNADYSKAEQHFRTALRAYPDDVRTLLNLGKVAQVQKQPDVAIDRYYEVLKREPNNFEAHFGLADAFAGEGQTQSALNEYAKAEELQPRDSRIFNNRGLIYFEEGNFDKATEQYRKAIELEPRSLPGYLNLANSQFQQGKIEEAKDTMEKALHIDPRSFTAWLNVGVMAASVNDLHDAELYFRNAIACKFDSAIAWNYLGLVLVRRGDAPGKTDHIGEAVGCYKRAAELDPTNPYYEQSREAAQQKRDEIIRASQQ
jgi:protein O-mannosyl-transferase